MLYGDDVDFLERGPRIRPKSLQPIGIYNESRCWGVWIPDSPGAKHSRDHLLISPFHPDRWAFLFWMQIKLRHAPGAMARLSKVLSGQGHNILFAECAGCGHNHATWNIVGEAHTVRDLLEREYRDQEKVSLQEGMRQPDPSGHKKKIAKSLRQKMLDNLHELKERIEIANLVAWIEDAESRFLHERFLSKSRTQHLLRESIFCEAWYEEGECPPPRQKVKAATEVIRAAIERFHTIDINGDSPNSGNPQETRHNPEESSAVQSQTLPALEHIWLNTDHNQKPLCFVYSEPDMQLQPENDWDFNEQCKRHDVAAFPTRAMASFDTREHYVRLRILDENERCRCLQISCDYWLSFDHSNRSLVSSAKQASPNGGESEPLPNEEALKSESYSSKGILKEITKTVAKQAMNVLRVSNSITRLDADSERGQVKLIGLTPPCADPQRIVARLEQDLKALDFSTPYRNTEYWKVAVRPHLDKHLFVSIHFPRHDPSRRFKRLRQHINEVAERWGLTPRYVETKAGDVSRDVAEELGRCDCLLQVVTWYLPDEGSPVNAAWLVGEYLSALTRKIPHARMVNTHGDSEVSQEWRSRLKTHRDQPFIEFDWSGDDEHLDAKIDEAIAALAHLLLEPRN